MSSLIVQVLVASSLLLQCCSGAKYGAHCTYLLTSCEYEGGGCDLFTSRCVCETETFVYNDRTNKCEKEYALGEWCDYDEECNSRFSECKDIKESYCDCVYGYYDDNGVTEDGGECRKRPDLGGTCVQRDGACVSPNSACIADKCKCEIDYYDDNGDGAGGNCVPVLFVGQSGCDSNVTNRCVDNSECINDTCTCKGGYSKDEDKIRYPDFRCLEDSEDKSYLPAGSRCEGGFVFYHHAVWKKCLPYSWLANVGVNTRIYTETTIHVTWATGPLQTNFLVDNYKIRWYPVVNGSMSDTYEEMYVADRYRSYTIRGLTPGRTYQIEVMSMWKGDEVYTVTVNGTTKPNKPGPILLDECDLDVRDRYATLRWTPSSGDTTYYKFQMTSFSLHAHGYGGIDRAGYFKTPESTHYLQEMEGVSLNVSIWACAGEDKTALICSDVYNTIVTLDELAPSVVQDVFCMSRGQGNVEMYWEMPKHLGGSLKNYEVDVYLLNEFAKTWQIHKENTTEVLQPLKTVEFKLPKATYSFKDVIRGLDNSRFYTFLIYARNAAGRSEKPGRADENELLYQIRKENLSYDYTRFAAMANRLPFGRPPVCSPVGDGSPVGKPSRVKVAKAENNKIKVTWRPPPPRNPILGYFLRIDNGRHCVSQNTFKCSSGCISEFLNIDFERIVSKISNPTCLKNLAMNITSSQLQTQMEYTPEEAYMDKKYTITVTSIGAFQAGDSATVYFLSERKSTPTTPKPESSSGGVCRSCRPVPVGDVLLKFLCQQPYVYVARRLRMKKHKTSDMLIKMKKRKSKLLYNLKESTRPRKSRYVLEDGQNCKCDVLTERKPRNKLITYRPSRKHYVVTAVINYDRRVRSLLKGKLHDQCKRYANSH